MARQNKSGRDAAGVHNAAASSYQVQRQFGAAAATGRTVGAAEFKANCLSLMDEVQQTGRQIMITKHNKPVAKLVPILDVSPAPFIGRGAGMFEIKGDIVSPLAPDWDEGDDI